ncbi:hypothetical protein SELMODRAFT_147956 [Selaginella moellendorffii]|uniref:DUF3700 domain-containing protein n=1 Tax=Selaginella moellendorffii TaxID=88036 RepID=D8RKU2_SELML|nr:stem-specific protein TSJT1 [Selaginella moellendorffii]EFJ27503.1 hypothetical protein SELMODRAFT_147956 [Selaginella moellendorffii]|eukprot:XP_002971754.1 stem-specific protein TSJT1 [Selaginella moellendorffii]
MLAVFHKSVAEAPQELNPKDSSNGSSAVEVAEGFVRAFPQAVQIQADKNCKMIYSHSQQALLRPRSFAAVDNIFCLFEGMLENLPTLRQSYGLPKSISEVLFVIEAYRALRDREPYPAHQVVRDLRGQFAFVLYDREARGVFTASDSHGKVPFFWGTAADGSLCFSDNATLLKEGCGQSFAPFPQGCFFASVVGLNSYEHPLNEMKPMPRVDSQGQICGATFKVDQLAKKYSPRGSSSFGKGTSWAASTINV